MEVVAKHLEPSPLQEQPLCRDRSPSISKGTIARGSLLEKLIEKRTAPRILFGRRVFEGTGARVPAFKPETKLRISSAFAVHRTLEHSKSFNFRRINSISVPSNTLYVGYSRSLCFLYMGVVRDKSESLFLRGIQWLEASGSLEISNVDVRDAPRRRNYLAPLPCRRTTGTVDKLNTLYTDRLWAVRAENRRRQKRRTKKGLFIIPWCWECEREYNN